MWMGTNESDVSETWKDIAKRDNEDNWNTSNMTELLLDVSFHMGEISQGVQSMEMMSYFWFFWPLF